MDIDRPIEELRAGARAAIEKQGLTYLGPADNNDAPDGTYMICFVGLPDESGVGLYRAQVPDGMGWDQANQRVVPSRSLVRTPEGEE